MAQPQYGAGTSASSPSVSATPVAGRQSQQTGSSANTPAQQQQNQHQHQRQESESAAQNSQHKRVYQACIPCRRRKVRCDLGSVDNPHDPPCVRCRRESKECFFSATRRKRKTDDDDEGSDVDEYIVRNGRKRLHAAESPPPRLDRRFYSEVPLTPGGSHGRSQPLRRPDGSGPRERRDSELDGDGDANLENLEAQTAMRRAVYNPHDALDLLYKAATDRSVVESTGKIVNSADLSSPAANNHGREGSIASATTAPTHQQTHQDNANRDMPRPRSISNVKPEVEIQPPHRQFQENRPQQPQQHPVDPVLAQQAALRAQPGYQEALRAWSRFRFVRAGWFTAQEAIEYID